MEIISSSYFVSFGKNNLILAQENNNKCANIVSPLIPEEEIYAPTAWQYFQNNYQKSTGFTNAARLFLKQQFGNLNHSQGFCFSPRRRDAKYRINFGFSCLSIGLFLLMAIATNI